MGLLRVLMLLTVACHLVAAFVAQPPLVRRAVVHNREAAPIVCAEPTPEEVTKKWGFEAGMFSALKGAGKGEGEGGGMVKAGDLLKRYGGAYLLTSTSLALVSFTLCYILVDNGVDVTGACFAQTADARAIFVPSRLEPPEVPPCPFAGSSPLRKTGSSPLCRGVLCRGSPVGEGRHTGELDLRDRGHGGAGLRRAQGRVADPLPADGRADTDRGEKGLRQERGGARAGGGRG